MSKISITNGASDFIECDESDVTKLISDGTIREDALCWRVGMGDWVPVRSMFPRQSPPPLPLELPKICENLANDNVPSSLHPPLTGLVVPIATASKNSILHSFVSRFTKSSWAQPLKIVTIVGVSLCLLTFGLSWLVGTFRTFMNERTTTENDGSWLLILTELLFEGIEWSLIFLAHLLFIWPLNLTEVIGPWLCIPIAIFYIMIGTWFMGSFESYGGHVSGGRFIINRNDYSSGSPSHGGCIGSLVGAGFALCGVGWILLCIVIGFSGYELNWNVEWWKN